VQPRKPALKRARLAQPECVSLTLRGKFTGSALCLLPAMLPVRSYIRTRSVQVDVLIDMIDPRQRNKVMVLATGRTLFGELDLVGALEMVDLTDRLSIRRNDVHVLLNERGISHVSSPGKSLKSKTRHLQISCDP
jgi:hypothetical protein